MVVPGKELLGWVMGEITCSEDVRQPGAQLTGDAPALREVCFNERAMLPAKPAEWVQCLDDSCALRPAASGSGSKSHHGNCSTLERRATGFEEILAVRVCLRQILGFAGFDVLDYRA